MQDGVVCDNGAFQVINLSYAKTEQVQVEGSQGRHVTRVNGRYESF